MYIHTCIHALITLALNNCFSPELISGFKKVKSEDSFSFAPVNSCCRDNALVQYNIHISYFKPDTYIHTYIHTVLNYHIAAAAEEF